MIPLPLESYSFKKTFQLSRLRVARSKQQVLPGATKGLAKGEILGNGDKGLDALLPEKMLAQIRTLARNLNPTTVSSDPISFVFNSRKDALICMFVETFLKFFNMFVCISKSDFNERRLKATVEPKKILDVLEGFLAFLS